MATLYSTALSVLAPVVDNGVLPGDPRVTSRVDEAQRRLINQYNFVSHREESLESPLTWQTGGTVPGDSSSALILDDIDSTKLMILCAFREENNQLEMAEALEKKAFAYVERDVINQVERARYTQFSTLALTDQNTFGGLVGRLGLEIFSRYKVPYSRLQSYVNQAYQQAIDHYNFVVRNEQYNLSSLTWAALVNDTDSFSSPITSEIVRGLTLSLISQNEDPETQSTSGKELQIFKEESLKLIERNIAQVVESQRLSTYTTKAATDQNTFGGIVGRVGLETMAQYKMPLARLQSFVNQAYQEAIDHYNFVVRREELQSTALTYSTMTSDSATFSPISVDILKTLTIAKIIGDSGTDTAGLRKQAYDLIERDVVALVEASRRSASGTEGKLANELVDGVKIPTARLTSYISQAGTDATAHWNFLARREDYSSGTVPNPFDYEIVKKLVESYVATSRGQDELATALKKEAFDLVERDLQTMVESARNAASGTEGKLANELVDGVKIPTSRLTTYIAQAGTDATTHWNFLARREDYSSGTVPSPFSYEIVKKLVESYVVTSRGQDELATALKKEAFDLVERDLMTGVEAARRTQFATLAATDQNTFGGIVGRLGLETVVQYKMPIARLQSFVNQAYQQAIDHYNFVVRSEQYEIPPLSYSPLVNDSDYVPQSLPVELIRAFAMALITGTPELKAEAQQLIARNVTASVHRMRYETRKSNAESYDQWTFGYHWGRVGLDLPEGLNYSDDQIKRAVNTAEELLMNAGKWVGTIDTYILPIVTSGEVFLPREVETILFAQFGSNPQPVYDRFNEWMIEGSGQRTTDQPWRYAFVDRGEGVDPRDGYLKRKYFVSYPDDQGSSMADRYGSSAFAPY